MALSDKDLLRRGVSSEDIRTAHRLQDAQRRTGSPVHTIGQIVTGRQPSATEPADLTERQLRKRGRYGTAAILADQEALNETTPERALKARHASTILKELANKPVQLEFDFFKGNWSVGTEYYDTIRDRVHALDMPLGRRGLVIMVLTEIMRWLPWENSACAKTATEIADLLKAREIDVSSAIKTLETVGAIHRVKRGRTKLIYVNPEGVYRGKIDHHAATVDGYKKAMTDAGNVVPIRGERP